MVLMDPNNSGRPEETQAQQEHRERMARINRWANHRLPRWVCRNSGALHDVMRNAQRAADNTGVPQLVWLQYEERYHDVVEPDRTVSDAIGGTGRMPEWVKGVLGW